MTILIEQINTSPHTSLFYEVIADQNVWAVCGRQGAVVNIEHSARYGLIVCHIDWWIDWLIMFLVDWFNDWLYFWWLLVFQIECLWLCLWLINWLIEWILYWLIDYISDWFLIILTDVICFWLIDWLFQTEHHPGRDAAGGRLPLPPHRPSEQVHSCWCQGQWGEWRTGRGQAGTIRCRSGLQHEQVLQFCYSKLDNFLK